MHLVRDDRRGPQRHLGRDHACQSSQNHLFVDVVVSVVVKRRYRMIIGQYRFLQPFAYVLCSI